MNRLDRQAAAFNKALEYCNIYGLYWRDHIVVVKKDKQIVGYYVLDETFSTAIKKIII